MTILDLSHWQGSGTPGNRVATIDMAQVKAAGCEAVIVRQSYGLRSDELAVEHNRRVDAVAVPRMIYWYPLTRFDPVRQAGLAFSTSGSGARRAWMDLEESAHNDGADPVFPRYSTAYFNHANAGLWTADDLFAMTTGIYSSKTYLDFWFTQAQQQAWVDAGRLLWVAHHNTNIPKPWVPIGYADETPPWVMWQDRVAPYPGVQGNCDQSHRHESVSLETILGQAVTPPDQNPIDVIRMNANSILGELE